jgi:hypothetical protein
MSHLLFALELYNAHRQPGCRLGDSLRISVVVLLRLDIGTDMLGRHHAHGVTVCCLQTAQVVCAAASFHSYDAGHHRFGEGSGAVQLGDLGCVGHGGFPLDIGDIWSYFVAVSAVIPDDKGQPP